MSGNLSASLPGKLHSIESFKIEARIVGLDALRFIAALWVMFAHCGAFPLTEGIDRSNTFALFVKGVYGNVFAGVPAVIVFFVISGFCVHYPYRTGKKLEVKCFLVRRYLRICIPLVVAILLARPLHLKLSLFQNSILWSLVAELIYYTLYPLLLHLATRFGWNRIILIAYVLAYCGVLTEPRALDYSPFGVRLNWLIALPCWLLGCRLAEVNFAAANPAICAARIWRWRAGIWFLSWACSVLRFHSPVGYPWTMNIFALAVFSWVRIEIISAKFHGGSRRLEWGGQWSYSIYLIHMIAMSGFVALGFPDFGFNLNWLLQSVFILSTAYLFYLLVERPGHFLARQASIRIRTTELAGA